MNRGCAVARWGSNPSINSSKHTVGPDVVLSDALHHVSSVMAKLTSHHFNNARLPSQSIVITYALAASEPPDDPPRRFFRRVNPSPKPSAVTMASKRRITRYQIHRRLFALSLPWWCLTAIFCSASLSQGIMPAHGCDGALANAVPALGFITWTGDISSPLGIEM